MLEEHSSNQFVHDSGGLALLSLGTEKQSFISLDFLSSYFLVSCVQATIAVWLPQVSCLSFMVSLDSHILLLQSDETLTC